MKLQHKFTFLTVNHLWITLPFTPNTTFPSRRCPPPSPQVFFPLPPSFYHHTTATLFSLFIFCLASLFHGILPSSVNTAELHSRRGWTPIRSSSASVPPVTAPPAATAGLRSLHFTQRVRDWLTESLSKWLSEQAVARRRKLFVFLRKLIVEIFQRGSRKREAWTSFNLQLPDSRNEYWQVK